MALRASKLIPWVVRGVCVGHGLSKAGRCFLLLGHALSCKSSIATSWHRCYMNFSEIALCLTWSCAKNCCMAYRDEPVKKKFYDSLASNLLSA